MATAAHGQRLPLAQQQGHCQLWECGKRQELTGQQEGVEEEAEAVVVAKGVVELWMSLLLLLVVLWPSWLETFRGMEGEGHAAQLTTLAAKRGCTLACYAHQC